MVIQLSRARVWIYDAPVDMRKSYDSLAGLAKDKHDILTGDMFLFLSKDRKKAKALFWDGTGLNIWMKRLERGQFAKIWLRGEMTVSELRLFFEGSKSILKKISPEYINSYSY